MKGYPMRALLAVLFCVLSVPAYAWDVAAMNRQIDATNFLVNRGCSGTLIGPDKVLTAAHCVLDQYRTVQKETVDKDGKVKKETFQIVEPGTVSQLEFSGSAVAKTTAYVYRVAGVDRALDLALLQTEVPLSERQVSKVACSDVGRGDVVFAVGNSYAVLYSTVTKGIVSSVTRSYRDLEIAGQLGDATDDGKHGLVQHSAVIAGGNSGGALYNDKGELVGVNVRGAASGFSFSVPLSDVHAFLAANNFSAECREAGK